LEQEPQNWKYWKTGHMTEIVIDDISQGVNRKIPFVTYRQPNLPQRSRYQPIR
jgi:hypothetical protein